MSGGPLRAPTPGNPSDDSKWLKRVGRLLAGLVGAELAEAILGDLLELRPTVEVRWGKGASWLWLVLEVVRGAAVLTAQRLKPRRGPRKEYRSVDNWKGTVRRAAAAVGLIACIPAVLLVVGGLLQSDWSAPALRSALERTLFNRDLVGFRILIHPATVLSGLTLAAGLNLVPLLRLRLERQPGTLVGMLSLRIRAAHLGVALIAIGLMGVILGYGFTENFKVVPTHSIGLESGWQYTAAHTRRVIIYEAYPTHRLYQLGSDAGTLWLDRYDGEGTWLVVSGSPTSGD